MENFRGVPLVSYHTETRVAEVGVFDPLTPSTEGGELYHQAFAEGQLGVFGHNTLAIEAEGEHTAQGGAIAHVAHKQCVKKFSRLGEAVVASNMEVMTQGFERVREIKVGALDAPDRSTLRGQVLLPVLNGSVPGAVAQ